MVSIRAARYSTSGSDLWEGGLVSIRAARYSTSGLTQPNHQRRVGGGDADAIKQRGAAPIGGNGRRHSSAGLGGITGTTCRTCVRPPQCIAVRLKLNGKLPRGTRIGQLPVQQFAASWQPREIDEDLHVYQFD